MKKTWMETLQLFSTNVSGFLAESSILVATGFLLLILFAFILHFLPQAHRSTWETLATGILILAAVHIMLAVIEKRLLFSISHANLVAVARSLAQGGGTLVPDPAPVRSGRRRIDDACGGPDCLARYSRRLHQLLAERIGRDQYPQRWPRQSLRTLLARTLLAAAVSRWNTGDFALELQRQLRLYIAKESVFAPILRHLWWMGLALNLAFFAFLFIPILFLFHSFSAPILIGLIMTLILISVFRRAFFVPLQQLALLNRFCRETREMTGEPGSDRAVEDWLATLRID